jgi:site-specific DNA-methyltransferase (adenine-specific)
MNNLEINKIYNESNLDTMSKMSDDFVDVIITSPPYNIGKSRINGGFNKKNYDKYNDNLSLEDYFKSTKIWIDEMLRVTKYHIFYNIQEVSGNRGIISYIMNEYKDNIKEVFIWAKQNPPSSIVETMCSSGYEYIFCISKDTPESRKFNYCNFNNRNGDYMKNIIIKPVNSGKENAGHSFAFGDWLPNHFINYFSKENDLIYDPFMGTGTTAKSAIIYKRNWIGSEISKDYIEIAEKRLKPYKTQLTMF